MFVGYGQRTSVAISQVANSSKSHKLHVKLKDNKRTLIMNTLSYTIDSMNTHVEQATIEQNFYKAECIKSRNDIERIHNLRCMFLSVIFSILLY